MKKSQSQSKKIIGITHRHQTYSKKTWKNQINNITKHYILIKGIIPSLNMNLPIKQAKYNNTNKKQKKFLSSNEIFERQMIFTQKLKKIIKDNNNNITKNKKSSSSYKKFNLSEKRNNSELLNNPPDSIDISNNKLQTYSTKCDYAILGTKLFNDLKLETEQMEQYLMSKYLSGTDNIISEIEEPAYISNNIEFLNTITNNNNDIKNQKNNNLALKKTTIDVSGKNSRNQNNTIKYNTKNFINLQTNVSNGFFTKFHTNLKEIKLKFQKNIKYNVDEEEEEKQSIKKVKNRRSKKKLPIIGERHKKSYKNFNNFYENNIRSASMTKRMIKNLDQSRNNNLSWRKSKKLKNSSLNSNDNISGLYINDNEFQNESLAIINEINDFNNNNYNKNNNSYINNKINYYQIDDKISNNSNKSFNSKLSNNNTSKKNKEENNNNGPKKYISVKRFRKINIPKLFLNKENNNNSMQTLKSSCSTKKMLCISDYVFIEELGKGSYAVVKLAIYKPTKEKFAIKIYNKQKLSNSQKNNYIKNEISVLRYLNSPNIMKLYKVIHTQHYLYLVMEYIDGISLLDVIQNDPKKRINESRCKKLFYQIVKAISYCQSKNICHRDIKLENILVQKNDIIKIIDFGFAIKCRKNQYQKLLCGTLCYMPPEIVNRKEYNPFYSDIWSLGVLLYAMLFGIFPFRGDNDEIIMDLINENDLTFPEDEDICVSEDVKDLLKGIFVTEPCKRLKPDEILEHRWFSN